jgi:hypothetical protein
MNTFCMAYLYLLVVVWVVLQVFFGLLIHQRHKEPVR